jgi:hypothetical protein
LKLYYNKTTKTLGYCQKKYCPKIVNKDEQRLSITIWPKSETICRFNYSRTKNNNNNSQTLLIKQVYKKTSINTTRHKITGSLCKLLHLPKKMCCFSVVSHRLLRSRLKLWASFLHQRPFFSSRGASEAEAVLAEEENKWTQKRGWQGSRRDDRGWRLSWITWCYRSNDHRIHHVMPAWANNQYFHPGWSFFRRKQQKSSSTLTSTVSIVVLFSPCCNFATNKQQTSSLREQIHKKHIPEHFVDLNSCISLRGVLFYHYNVSTGCCPKAPFSLCLVL